MPADRKKPAARRADDAFKQSQFESQVVDLQWNPPADFQQQTIEFTTNVTPTTYTYDTPPPLHTPTTFIFPPEDSTPPLSNDPPKARHRKGSGYIPRPPNAFILFRSSFIKSQHVTSAVETNHSTLSKIIGMTWQNLPHDERQAWHVKAKEALEEHKRKWPQYAFKPASSKSTRKKRKVRETEPKDIKRCEKIVELLCNGKKGDELDEAVKDFDRSHVPEVVTRFEVPITARAYRRSSSAPLPDTHYEHAKQVFLPSAESVVPQRRRSSSAEPGVSTSHGVSSSLGEIKLPASGLVQFDPGYSVASPADALSYKQEHGFIDFSAYSFGTEAPCDFGPLFGLEPSPSPSIDYSLTTAYPANPRKLSINTAYLNQWADQSSPMPSIPSSPSYYSASSPSEIHTPYEEYYTQSDSFGFGYNAPYGGMDMTGSEPNTSASSPAPMSSYYPEYVVSQVKDEVDYIHHHHQQNHHQQYVQGVDMGLNYAAYGAYGV